MPEKCPLGEQMYWQNEQYNKIPEACLVQCGSIWDEALLEPADDIDILDKDCHHVVEYNDTSLQRLEGSGRSIGILNTCIISEEEAFSETWHFKCPNN